MKRDLRVLVAAGPLLLALSTAQPAFAQKAGGILKIGHFDSPASMSMLEESTAAVNRPVMGVLNNLVMYKQDVPQNSPQSIVPEIATSWTWDEEGTALTLPLRQGVKWHDGKPFNAADVKCTFDLLQGKASEKLRINPRKSWYDNLASVTNNGDYEVTFHLKRPQASFLAMLATGWSPIYPCHVPPAQMRRHRTVQIRRVQAKPVDHSGPQPGLLEAGTALSRRHRMDGYKRRVDSAARLHLRQDGFLPCRHNTAVEGRDEPGAAGGLQDDYGKRQPQSARQPERAALRQLRFAAGDDANPRPQGV